MHTDYKSARAEFLYENDTLKVIFTSAGRIVPVDDNGEVLYKFEYNLQDHLGNTRIVFGGNDNGRPELLQTTDYYPFGMVMNQQNYFDTDVLANKYLYNGKELQDDVIANTKLDWYDYGARFYDPQLGRWHSVDPLAEWAFNITPYRYAFNNPLRFIDPNGMFESKKDAKRYKRKHKEKGRVRKNADGSFSIDNKKAGTSIWNDSEYGISTGALALGDGGNNKASSPWRIFMQEGGYSGTGNGGESIGRGYRAKHNYGTLDHSYFNSRFGIFYSLNRMFRNRDYSQSTENGEGQITETSDNAINESMGNTTNNQGKPLSKKEYHIMEKDGNAKTGPSIMDYTTVEKGDTLLPDSSYIGNRLYRFSKIGKRTK